jgi:hypothetical protein
MSGGDVLILDPVPTPQFVRVPASTRPVEFKIRSLTELQDEAVKTHVIAIAQSGALRALNG